MLLTEVRQMQQELSQRARVSTDLTQACSLRLWLGDGSFRCVVLSQHLRDEIAHCITATRAVIDDAFARDQLWQKVSNLSVSPLAHCIMRVVGSCDGGCVRS